VMWFHANRFGVPLMVLGFLGVIITMISWWKNTITEAHTGYHTPVVQLHLRYGMILFIASEVMLSSPGSGLSSTARSSRLR